MFGRMHNLHFMHNFASMQVTLIRLALEKLKGKAYG